MAMTPTKTTVPALEVKPSHEAELVKAGDLIEVLGSHALNRADRILFNLLLKNAHGSELGTVGSVFEIDLAELHNTDETLERITASVKKLMGTVVEVQGDPSWDEDGLGLTQLLGECDISSPSRMRGKMRYSFPPKMARLLRDATVYARLQTDVMESLSSKYALVLYELVSKRKNMHMTQEVFTIAEFRSLIGVPDGKLNDWSNLRKFCIEPAVAEVSALADFWVGITPRKTGRITTHVILSWGNKDNSALMEAQRELSRHSLGRKARQEGGMDRVLE
jgi:hypothetical protein